MHPAEQSSSTIEVTQITTKKSTPQQKQKGTLNNNNAGPANAGG